MQRAYFIQAEQVHLKSPIDRTFLANSSGDSLFCGQLSYVRLRYNVKGQREQAGCLQYFRLQSGSNQLYIPLHTEYISINNRNNMRKAKGKKGERICETEKLHHDGIASSDFEHHSRIPADIKRVLQAMVGKRKFKGYICKRCRDLGSLEIHQDVPVNHDKLEDVSLLSNLDITDLGEFEKICMDLQGTSHVTNDTDTNSVNALHENGDNQIPKTCVSQDGFESIPISHGAGSSELTHMHLEPTETLHSNDLPSTKDPSHTNRSEDIIVLRVSSLRHDLKLLSEALRECLAFELAQTEREEIQARTAALSKKENRELSILSSICNKDYLLSLNKVLVSFLLGLSTDSTSTNKDPSTKKWTSSEIYKLGKVTESCMSLTRTIGIMPIHFREQVILYTHTGSRTALKIMASMAPHGSYQTVRTWIDELAGCNTDAKPCSEKGDYVGCFDNNQVMTRRWNITTDKKAICSVITMVIYLEIDAQGELQFQEELKPGKWMWNNLNQTSLARLRKGHRDLLCLQERFHRHYGPWMTGIIMEVAREQMASKGLFFDEIDKAVAQGRHAKTTKTCSNCSLEFPRSKRKCTNCKQSLNDKKPTESMSQTKKAKPKKGKPLGEIEVFLDETDDQKWKIRYEKETVRRKTEYDDIPAQHPAKPPKVIVGKPIFRNPCSFESVTQVFRDIGKAAGIKQYGDGKREWLAIVCDGLPYLLGYQIIERTYRCTLCNTAIQGSAELLAHKAFHFGAGEFYQEFSWLLLQPGPGHVEINMIRSFVKFTWPIFWERMVEIFNFHSEVAKRSAFTVSDHHKGMLLAKIAREAIAKELALPYVRKAMSEGSGELSVEAFMKFTLGPELSANYALMVEVLSILDSIFLYRKGLRSGDTQLIDSGPTYYGRMWCARNHPIYRQIHAYDNIMAANMPPAILEFIQRTKSFNLSGVAYTGEGADFKMEEVNKNVQHWLRSSPSEKDWNNACANHQKLTKLLTQTFVDTGLKDNTNPAMRPEKDISQQVGAFRTTIRESDFLSGTSEDTLTSITKEPLDPDLVNFTDKAADKESIYLENFLQHKESNGFMDKKTIPFHEDPIFILPQERAEYEDISNKSANDIKYLIETKIAEITDWEMRSHFKVVYKKETLPKRNKDDLIHFYNMLVDYENCASDGDMDSDVDDEENVEERSAASES